MHVCIRVCQNVCVCAYVCVCVAIYCSTVCDRKQCVCIGFDVSIHVCMHVWFGLVKRASVHVL